MATDLQHEIQTAHVTFVRSTSKLLECADEVKRQRDKLLRLLAKVGANPS